MAEDGMYLDNLDEFINDENKIVTYKWLSRTLSVHVNTAKQMLYAFVQKQSENDLHVTYLVAGLSHKDDDKVHVVQIVPGEKLDPFKASLDSITSCHIYSVQKAKLKDTSALYMADYEATKNNLLQSNEFSAIACPWAKPRSEEELQKLKVKAQPTKEAPNFSKPANEKTTTAHKKKADIGSMFANQKKKSPEKNPPAKEEKTAEPKESTKTSSAKSKTNEKPTKSKQGGLSTFFANQAARPKKEKPPAPTEKETDKEEKKESKEEKKESVVKAKAPVKKAVEKKQNNSSGRKNANNTHDDGKDKKRRRIQKVWSDSSDDEEEEEEMEVEEPPPPSPPAPVETLESEPEEEEEEAKELRTDTNSSGKRRKRTKKMVSKTYVNDEGYMVTEKVMESASETDQSEAEEVKAPPPKAAPTKAPPKTSPTKDKPKAKKAKVSPEKKKQGNIMSFFKKK